MLGFMVHILSLGAAYVLPGELLAPVSSAAPLADGTLCIGCTIIMSLFEEGNELETLLEKLCPIIAKKNATKCDAAIKAIVQLLIDGESPDKVCKDVGLCPKNGTCALRPNWPHADAQTMAKRAALLASVDGAAAAVPSLVRASRWARSTIFPPLSARGRDALALTQASSSPPPLTGVPCAALNISCLINRFSNLHLPIVDADDDGFGATGTNAKLGALDGTLRGYHWRGRDCGPTDQTIRPGTAQDDRLADLNCNGIVGAPSAGAATFETTWCGGSDVATRGLAILGDSATAHFHIPPKWLNASGWKIPNLNTVLQAAADELDRPECSWGTGHDASVGDRGVTTCPDSYGLPLSSLYQRMRARNLCMHRDFQNVGENGARSSHLNLAKSLQRTPEDKPLLVMVALVGNDVCNGHAGSGSMTTPDDFRKGIVAILDELDTKLPLNSHVAIVGLVDGRILWNTMHARVHPLGSTYAELCTYFVSSVCSCALALCGTCAIYVTSPHFSLALSLSPSPSLYYTDEFLSCHDDNPCWGWLNKNETWRNFTSARARELNAVSASLANATAKVYRSFDLHYFDFDFQPILDKWVAAGHDAGELIEPSDGFHPSQVGHMLQAETFYNGLLAKLPDAIGPVNPNNAAILKQFGNQGGE